MDIKLECDVFSMDIKEEPPDISENTLRLQQNDDNSMILKNNIKSEEQSQEVMDSKISRKISNECRGINSNENITESNESDKWIEKSFECNVCEKKFNMKKYLKKHLFIHSGSKPYECDICKKGFTENSSLQRHIVVHSGIKPYECKICKERFTQKGYLKIHLFIHSGRKPYECDICKSRFAVKAFLKPHLLTHSTRKPYECDICKKRFSQSRYLKSHVIVHSADKPYKCEICKKGFTQKRLLECHGEFDCVNIIDNKYKFIRTYSRKQSSRLDND